MERLSSLYASALLDLALEQNAIDDYYKQAVLIRDTLEDSDIKRVLVHPRISASEKHDLFKTVFSGHIKQDLLGFLFLTVDKNREKYLLPALSQLIENIDRYNNKIKATVLSAAPYDKGQAKTLEAMLSAKLDKKVELDLKVDPSVVGGTFIYADGHYADGTVKKRLRDMTRSMKEGCSA